MLRKGWLLLLLLLASSVEAFTFELPLLYDEREVGFVIVEVEGNTLVEVEGASLALALGSSISTELQTTLTAAGMIDMQQLNALGIEIAYRPRTMELVARLQESAFGSDQISFAQSSGAAGLPAPVSRFAWLNNLNVAAEHEFEESNDQINVDWLGQLNVGGIRGVNLTWSATATHESVTNETDVYRGQVTAFHDIPNVPMRLSAGDVYSPVVGHLGGASLGGISVASSYYELQPNRSISPGTSQQILVRERAELEVYVNGRLLQRLRLAPGRYNLTELPLAHGANDIEVYLYYASGDYEIQTFSQFFNAELLRPGLTNFGFSYGYRSEFTPLSGTTYSDDTLASAFVEHGLFSWLTLGAHGQSNDFGELYGVSTAFATPIGNFAARYSMSDVFDVEGEALSVEWQQRVWGSLSGSPNLRVAWDRFDRFDNRPWLLDSELHGERWLGSYSAYIGRQFELRFSYQDDRTRPGVELREEEVRGTYRWRWARLGAGVRRSSFFGDIGDEDEYQAFVTIDINIFRPRNNMRYSARYDSYNEQAQVSVGKASSHSVGDTSFMLSQLESDSSSTTFGRLDYLSNRARFGTFGQYRRAQGTEAGYAGGQMNTAFGWAGSRFGWGRAGVGPFTVVSRHKSLRDSEILVNEGRAGPEAISQWGGGALLTSRARYRGTTVFVDVPDAPIGYDWGGGQYLAEAGAVTGTSVVIGSDAFYSVLGILVDEDGEPLYLEGGSIEGEGLRVGVFTNRSGRFIAEGLRPGDYEITLLHQPDVRYRLRIEEGGDSFVRIGTLHPQAR
ncbi:fimbria/pilus outer membrane usher protein [Aliidiomarina soli]|uniref:Pilus assembly protein PapC n=1 Tax=Aliidiomarina soli TaxID=1928574 RepID=A0A432WFY6_9GAMM|nr:fimbria/pilus outer membrane usher protein [Aliidiomarina soli]RUO32609.1 hypothetical protein CWE14_10750 [Aliidiomarina soli]